MKKVLCLFIILIFMLLSVSCNETTVTLTNDVDIALGAMPDTFDPQMSTEVQQFIVTRNCFEGLFRLLDGEIVNASCEDYTLSADKLTYTFKIKDGLYWSNGKSVTADDFAFGLVRSLSAETLTPDANLLFSIKNGEKYYKGKVREEDLGIKAEGQTLTVQLEKADGEFIEKLSYAFAVPCNRSFFYSTKGRYLMDKENSIYNGPYKITYWNEEKKAMCLNVNEDYKGDFKAQSDGEVTLYFDTYEKDLVSEVKSGGYDLAYIDKTIYIGNTQTEGLTVYDTSWGVFFNPGLENAISDSKVRASLSKAMLSADFSDSLPTGFKKSRTLIPDDFTFMSKGWKDINPQVTAGTYSLETAREDFIKALEKHGSRYPEAALLYVEGEEMKALATAIVSNWQVNLGAYINIKGVTLNEMKNLMATGNYQLALAPMSDSCTNATAFINQFNLKDKTCVLKQYTAGEGELKKLTVMPQDENELALYENKVISSFLAVPIAQSGSVFAIRKGLKINADIYQGHIDLFSAEK